MSDLTIRCECGTLTGVLEDVSPKRGNHMMCYCDDCQRYARYLGDVEKWLDEWGGTEVFQVAPAKIKILTGADQLKCVRLKPKGIYRYYAKCCRTPIANTISYKTAFAGLPVAILHGENKDALLGPITHAVMGTYANGAPPLNPHPKFSFGSIVKVMALMLTNKIKGNNAPTPFFTSDGKSVSPPEKL